ncbi:MAG: 50S ribosome-binding GTPase [Nanoarchaeota archaeon]|nr:50S ribosome-binding GTPase [Nanoarchaeota archaeon]
MASFWKHVNKVLREADIIIEVLDARLIEETRNEEIEKKIKVQGKIILYVINKCDLVNVNQLYGIKKTLKPSVFISSRDHLGTTILKKKILELSRGEKVTVGVLGYPNVGKSSLINALSGKGSARTSSESGYTKGVQKIRVDNKILLIDSPGVFPRKEKDAIKHGKTGAIDFAKIKDAEHVALNIIEDGATTLTNITVPTVTIVGTTTTNTDMRGTDSAALA